MSHRSLLTICLCPKTLQQTAVMLNLFKLGNSAVPLQRHQATKIYTRNFCLAINGTEWDKKGLLLEEKPELKRVLEQRRLERHKEEEMARQRPSDLEMELRKRQQKLQEYEQEEIRQRENQQKIPEFVRVRDNLRRTQTFDQP
ncbi:Protein FAM107B [Oryzias melastigma]|uniref:Protein FAM107B n=1 Tax=Oryzias melastigma TaxID=30732 RepID=A0A834F8E8_ORYME|nr:Protein FAM107B [Oryzias melastigma]